MIVCGGNQMPIEEISVFFHVFPQAFNVFCRGDPESFVDHLVHDAAQFRLIAQDPIMNVEQGAEGVQRRVIKNLGPQVRKNDNCRLTWNHCCLKGFGSGMDSLHHYAVGDFERAQDDGCRLDGNRDLSGRGDCRADKNIGAQASLRTECPREDLKIAEAVL